MTEGKKDDCDFNLYIHKQKVYNADETPLLGKEQYTKN